MDIEFGSVDAKYGKKWFHVELMFVFLGQEDKVLGALERFSKFR